MDARRAGRRSKKLKGDPELLMWHRVAAMLGRSVAETRETLSSAEFVDWCAFYSLEPWGWHADAWRMGVLAATTANYSGNVKKALKPSDFMPSDKPKVRSMSEAEISARLAKDIEQAGKPNGE
jgi:hypothetical protein